MSFLDKLKIGKSKDVPARKTSEKKSEDNVLDLVKEETPVKAKPAALKGHTGDAYRVLIKPHFSEKATMLSSVGKYVFVVHLTANKTEVKKAVEKVYDVHVASVNMVNIVGKPRRYGRSSGRTGNWKKAVVALRSGEKIEGLSAPI